MPVVIGCTHGAERIEIFKETCGSHDALDGISNSCIKTILGCLPRRHHQRPAAPKALRIYEAHVGMASEQEKVASYFDFSGEIHAAEDRQGLLITVIVEGLSGDLEPIM